MKATQKKKPETVEVPKVFLLAMQKELSELRKELQEIREEIRVIRRSQHGIRFAAR